MDNVQQNEADRSPLEVMFGSENGKVRSDALGLGMFDRLEGYMLFPRNAASAKMHPLLLKSIVDTGLQIIDEDGAAKALEGPPPLPFLVTAHYEREVRARRQKGIEAGEAALCHMRIWDHYERASVSLAEWFLAAKYATRTTSIVGGVASMQKYRARIHKSYEDFWPVAHLWAAWCILHEGRKEEADLDLLEKISLMGPDLAPKSLLRLLHIAGDFERRLSSLSLTGAQQGRHRAGELIRLPCTLKDTPINLPSEPLTHVERGILAEYSVYVARALR